MKKRSRMRDKPNARAGTANTAAAEEKESFARKLEYSQREERRGDGGAREADR